MQLEQKIFSASSKLSAAFTVSEATNVVTSNGHGLQNEDKIRVSSSTTLPAGLSANTDYYVRDVTTNTFKLSLNPGGPEVDITDAGTGTHTLSLKGRVIFCDGFEHISLSVNTSGSANLTLKVQGADSEDVPDFNAAQSTSNRWDYINVVDSQNSNTIVGDTGLSPAGVDDNRRFEVNVNSLRWITVAITSYTAGAVEVMAKLSKSYD